VNAVTDLVLKKLGEPKETSRYRWDALLNPAPQQTYAVAAADSKRPTTKRKKN
jgi:hypothetical protein